jgi:hypothetical protein
LARAHHILARAHHIFARAASFSSVREDFGPFALIFCPRAKFMVFFARENSPPKNHVGVNIFARPHV